MDILSKIILEYGPSAGILIAMLSALAAYIWRDWHRIQALETRVQTLEEEFRDKLAVHIVQMEQALRDSTEAVTLSRRVVERFLLKNG